MNTPVRLGGRGAKAAKPPTETGADVRECSELASRPQRVPHQRVVVAVAHMARNLSW
jgi:hypothetical protein